MNTVLQRYDIALSHSFGLMYMSLHNNLKINISNSSLGLVSSKFSPLRSGHELFFVISFQELFPTATVRFQL